MAIKRLRGKRELYLKLIEVFRSDAWIQFRNFESGLQQNEIQVAVNSLHTLKGLAGTMGTIALQELTTEIEVQLKQAIASRKEVTNYQVWIKDIEKSLNEALAQMEIMFPQVHKIAK
ncbi:Hpt domain-containing protein [Shewanella psychropiezotolerans]|uniref:Hpt domain-containing protein n=1 Tax=Shewanella psychropiezotolerans TaxID=2593655 RepID=A0ABX5WU59_9GAMM|nr:Hpt domain-containing protein [Shewanella psychropiezotolerans]QDO82632.1 Hpt domain-containing protein [Shewanella psychropiezotolerans]